MSEVFYESIPEKKSDLLLTKYSSLVEIYCAESLKIFILESEIKSFLQRSCDFCKIQEQKTFNGSL